MSEQSNPSSVPANNTRPGMSEPPVVSMRPLPPPPKPGSPNGGDDQGGFFSRFTNRGGGSDGDGGGGRMSFLDHLLELRKRLWISVLAVFISMVLSLVFFHEIFDFLRRPLDQINIKYRDSSFQPLLDNVHLAAGATVAPLRSTSLLGTSIVIMWLSIAGGMLLSSPVLLYEVWSFVAPGLREREKRAIKPILYGGIFSFLLGCAVAYYVLFPVSLEFFIWFDLYLGVEPSYNVDDYMMLFIMTMAITGALCEIPLLVGVFAKLGVVKPEYLTKYWRACVLVSFILGSVLSPGNDVMSMLVFSAMILAIYVASIIMALIFYKRRIGT